MKRSAFAAVLVASFLPPAVARAQDRWAVQVREDLMSDAEVWTAMGYRMVGDVVTGSLNDDATSTHQVVLQAGNTYVITGACDEDCSDLDLRLYGGDGGVIDEDLELDDYPMVEVAVSGSGTFRVEVIMADCSADPCRWGFGVFGLATSEAGSSQGLDYSADPSYGTVTLASGFSPDPYEQSIQAGGDDEVTLGGAGCSGYVNADAPDLNLDYTAGMFPLHIYATSSTDITLVVNTPSGEWLCSDDADGTDPHVLVSKPGSGIYNIWIGIYTAVSGKLPSSVLYISEMEPRR